MISIPRSDKEKIRALCGGFVCFWQKHTNPTFLCFPAFAAFALTRDPSASRSERGDIDRAAANNRAGSRPGGVGGRVGPASMTSDSAGVKCCANQGNGGLVYGIA